MELVECGRILWRRRWFVAAAFAVAVLVGILLSFRVTLGLPPKLHSRAYSVGEATAQVLIDTHRSQISDLNPSGAANLYPRASLVANLMATAPIVDRIATRLQLSPGDLAVTPPPSSILPPIKATALGIQGARAGPATAKWTLAIALDPNLPLVSFRATAPSPSGAYQLVTAVISVLTQLVTSTATAQHVPVANQVVVNTIGTPLAGPVVRGPRKLYGVVASLVIFLGLCFVLVVSGADRRSRATDRQPLERGGGAVDQGRSVAELSERTSGWRTNTTRSTNTAGEGRPGPPVRPTLNGLPVPNGAAVTIPKPSLGARLRRVTLPLAATAPHRPEPVGGSANGEAPERGAAQSSSLDR
jgi:hypothetical protein